MTDPASRLPPRIFSGASPAQVAADLAPLVDFQAAGIDRAALDDLLAQRLLPHLMRYDAPGFQSMFNAAPAPDALLGAELALLTNQGVTNWQVSPGGAMLEELTAKALCRLFGLGPNADATFMYSGTYANQQALYLALHRHAERCGFDLAQRGLAGFPDLSRLAVLVSADAHFSVRHAVRMVGLGEDALISVPVDENRRMDMAALAHTLAQITPEREVVAVVVTAGTTSTGAVDPIGPAADLCAQTGAWLHVDGAYGFAYALVPEAAPLFAGAEQADSITWDPHKQLGVPIPNSLLFVKQADDFRRMALHSGYFNRAGDDVPNPGTKSVPSTRPLSALPLVTALKGRGMDGVVADLRAHLDAIRGLADALESESHPDQPIRPVHRPDTGILCFRLDLPGLSPQETDDLHRAIYRRILAEGTRTISVTVLDGRTVLRLLTVSAHIRVEDFLETIIATRRAAHAVLNGSTPLQRS